nr:MAG TPA: hypothetical protein [Caudoviricetes sp.]
MQLRPVATFSTTSPNQPWWGAHTVITHITFHKNRSLAYDLSIQDNRANIKLVRRNKTLRFTH